MTQHKAQGTQACVDADGWMRLTAATQHTHTITHKGATHPMGHGTQHLRAQKPTRSRPLPPLQTSSPHTPHTQTVAPVLTDASQH